MWCALIGVAIGFWLAYSFIFPSDLLNIRLVALTIGDILRIFGGLIVTAIAGFIGHIVDIGMGNSE